MPAQSTMPRDPAQLRGFADGPSQTLGPDANATVRAATSAASCWRVSFHRVVNADAGRNHDQRRCSRLWLSLYPTDHARGWVDASTNGM